MNADLHEIETKWTELEIGSIKPDPRTPRRRQRRSVAEIAKSIREFGLVQPIVVDEGHTVLIGHGRLGATRCLGYRMIPAVVVIGLTDAQKWRLQIADNRLAELSDWDEARLIERMERLSGENQTSVPGFSRDELEDIIGIADVRKANAESPPQWENTPEQSELHLLVSCRASAKDRMRELVAALKNESWCALEQGTR